jgi:hypothetical protein
MNGYSIQSRLGGRSSPSRGEGKYALHIIYDAMLLLSLLLPIPLLVMAVQLVLLKRMLSWMPMVLVLLKRMLVIQDQRMALDQGRTKPPIQWFISLHAHVFASDLPRCSHRYSPVQSNILYMYD